MSLLARRGGWGLAGGVIALCAAAAPVHAQALRVTEVDVRGNQRINKEVILSVIGSKVGDEASAERLERDRAAIEGLGFFRNVAVLPERVGNNVRVIFSVEEYPVIKKIEVTGSTIFPEGQLTSGLKLKNDQVFNRSNWAADRAAIIRQYTDKGYLVRIEDNADVTPPDADFEGKGIIRMIIHELRISKVNIKFPDRQIKDRQGNVVRTEPQQKTRTYVVLRELSQRQGALYNTRMIGEDYRRLADLPYFELVEPTQSQGEELDTIELTWNVKDKQTGQVSVGAGYSPRQHLIGRIELSEQNFQGKGQSVSIAGEIGSFGGDGLPSVELSYYEPWLTSTHTSLSVNVYDKLVYRFSQDLIDTRNLRDGRYFERRLGGQVAFGRPFQWPITLGVRYDDVHVGDFSKKITFPTQDGSVAAVSATRYWNSRDYANNPTTGVFSRFTTEVGYARVDKSNVDSFDNSIFTKFIGEYRRYYRLRGLKSTKEPDRQRESEKVPVVAVRLLAGHILSDVPFFEQFFVGGSDMLRGYLEDRFWGNTMYLGSVEYRHPLFPKITGVLFADVGDAFGSQSNFRFGGKKFATDFRQHGSIRPFASIGIGLRVATPIGPIRLDFGYGEEGGRTHFSIGHAF